MGMAIHKAIRYSPDKDRFNVTLPSGGTPTTINLPAGDQDLTINQMALTIGSLLDVVDSGFDVGVDGDQIYIRHGTAFDLDFTSRPALATFIGAESSYTNKFLVKFDGSIVYYPSIPWRSNLLIVRYIKSKRSHQNKRTAIFLGKTTGFEVEAPVLSSEFDSLRDVLRHLYSGLPITWFRDADNLSDWSTDNWTGKLVVKLSPNSVSWSEDFLTSPHQTYMQVPFELVKIQ